MTVTYRTAAGRHVSLSDRLGSGGEGDVYAVIDDPALAAKIYKPSIVKSRRDKVIAMTAAGWDSRGSSVAFPKEALFDARGEFAGFTMAKAPGRKPAHELYTPIDRKTKFPTAAYPFLVRAAANAARSIVAAHAMGYVVGDINHSGVLVGQDATVILIDSDSFQVRAGGRTYPCVVGMPEFTPPELQGKAVDGVIRTLNHDAFGVAVLAFHTLMMGRHPFSGRWRGQGNPPPIEQAIVEHRFAYSLVRTRATGFEPPPHAPTLSDLPASLAQAFDRAFAPASASGGRPSAAEWTTLLDAAESELVACPASKAHNYFQSAPGCPWCRMEQALPGFFAFNPVVSMPGATIDLGELIRRMQNVPSISAPPALTSLMPPLSLTLPIDAVATRKMRLILRGTAPVLVALGAILLGERWPGPVIGTISMLFGVALCFYQPKAQAKATAALLAAEQAWISEEHAFAQTGRQEAVSKVKDDAMSLVARSRALVSEESRRLTGLDAARQISQLRRFLEGQTLARAKLKGIGSTRLIALRSWNIETAAEVDITVILEIPGFGPATANTLLNWRRSLEAKFQFDPRQPVNPLDVAAVKADVARRQALVRTRLETLVRQLEAMPGLTEKARNDAIAIAIPRWHMFQQATLTRRALDFTTSENAQLLAYYVGSIALFVLSKKFGF